MVPFSPSSCSLAQRFSPCIRLLVALFRGNDFVNGTSKNMRMKPHPGKAQNPLPDLRIGSSTRPAAPPRLAGRAGPEARPFARHKQSTGLFVSGLSLR